MDSLLGAIFSIYKVLLHGYPRAFQTEFGEEMQAVFAACLEETTKQGIRPTAWMILRELCDTTLAILRARLATGEEFLRHMKEKASRLFQAGNSYFTPPGVDGRSSWKQAFLEISLFLLAGFLSVLTTYLPRAWLEAGLGRTFGVIRIAILLLPVPIFLAGLRAGLPRWSFPYGGILLGYLFLALVWLDRFPFFVISFILAVCLAIAAAMINTQIRPIHPLVRRWGASLGQDFTRLSFGFYGLMPLVIIIAFDDPYWNNRTPFLALSALLMIAGALAYSRSTRPGAQLGALLAGLTAIFCSALLDGAAFKGFLGAWSSAGWMVKLWANLAVCMIVPYLIRFAARAIQLRGLH